MKKNTVFYGWYVVLAGALISGVGIGLYSNCTSVFIKPVCDALGFSRGQFSLYGTISMLTSTLMMPLYGDWFRRFGMKRLMLAGTILCSLVPLAYSLSDQLWQFYLIAFINGLLINGISVIVVGALIGAWFKDRKGTATGIAFAGSGLFASVMIPVTGRIIEMLGWRWAYRVLGLLGLVILLPTVLLIREKPAQLGLTPYVDRSPNRPLREAEAAASRGLTRGEALRTPTFWLLFAGILGINFCGGGLLNHTIPFLSDIGYPLAMASGVASLLMLTATAGKLGLGILFDKFGTLVSSAVMGICCIVYTLLALLARLPFIPWIYGAALGLGCAGGTVAITPLVAGYFGDIDFVPLYSLGSTAALLGAALAPPLLGFIFDSSGSYLPGIWLTLAAAVLTTLCLIGAFYSSRSYAQVRLAEAAEVKE